MISSGCVLACCGEGLGVAGRLGADGIGHPELGDRLADRLRGLVERHVRLSGCS